MRMVHGIETHPLQRTNKMMYVRTGDSKKSATDTDLGVFQIATEGVPFGGSGAQEALVGELWVTYKVKLSRSKLFGSVLGEDILWTQLSTIWDSSNLADGGDVEQDGNIAVTQQVVGTNNLGILFPQDVDDGYFHVTLSISGGPGTQTVPMTASNPVNCTIGIKTGESGTGAGEEAVLSFLLAIDAPSSLNQASFDTNIHLNNALRS